VLCQRSRADLSIEGGFSCVAAFLTELFNRSLQSGRVPALFKSAYVTPLIKKLDLDASNARSYRPISNLTVVSKLLERLVARHLIAYLKQHDLLPRLQSAYRSGHSTETAVLRVLSDILLAIDSGDVAVLAMLDLSAAFDTVDHQILLQRLQISFEINDLALSWFQSYLKDRVQQVRLGTPRSSVGRVLSRIPQGSGTWTDFVPAVYGGLSSGDRTSKPVPAFLRRRCPNQWLSQAVGGPTTIVHSCSTALMTSPAACAATVLN
jgi:hypothetical protein